MSFEGGLLSSLFPSGADCQPEGLALRRGALERVLLAVAGNCPALGYCQGLHVLAAFAMSVAEEAGLSGDKLEAETFAFVADALELQGP